MIVSLWILSGIVGGIILWVQHKINFGRHEPFCPTPRAIMLIVIGSVGGPIVLAAALFVIGLHFCEFLSENLGDSWFTRPICRKRNR